MRRCYSMTYELHVTLGHPTPADEAAIRTLDAAVTEFIRDRVDEFPWPVDLVMAMSSLKVAEE